MKPSKKLHNLRVEKEALESRLKELGREIEKVKALRLANRSFMPSPELHKKGTW
tara:strand:- start:513 stop:674 length:162 start_codon:yes stop_codon:yes gene_type:complete